MTWFRVEVGACTHPKMYALARELRVRRSEAIGCVIALWSFRSHRPTGALDWDWIRDEAGVRCQPTRLRDAMIAAGWVRDGKVNDWGDYNAKLVARQEREQVRKKRTRGAWPSVKGEPESAPMATRNAPRAQKGRTRNAPIQEQDNNRYNS